VGARWPVLLPVLVRGQVDLAGLEQVAISLATFWVYLSCLCWPPYKQYERLRPRAVKLLNAAGRTP
jgi:hypothetical protein